MNKSRQALSIGKLILAGFLISLAVVNLAVNLKIAGDFVKPADIKIRLLAITLAFLSVAIPLVVAALIISREVAKQKINRPNRASDDTKSDRK